MTRITKDLRAYVIGAEAFDETNKEEVAKVRALIDSADFSILPVWEGGGPVIGFQFDTGPDFWGRVEIVRIESPRIVICRAVVGHLDS